MNSTFRLAAFAVFGIAGIGLAVALATIPLPGVTRDSESAVPRVAVALEQDRLTVPPTDQAPPAESSAALEQAKVEPAAATTAVAPASPPTQANPAPPDTGPASIQASPTPDPTAVSLAPVEPQLVPAHPVYAQQGASHPADSEVLRRLELLTQALATQTQAQQQPQPAAEGDAETNSPPAPEAPSSQPPANSRPAAKRQPKSRITRSIGEGDSNLSVHIQDTDIRDVLDLLSEQGNLNILASNNVQGKVSAALNDVDIDTALQAILRSTGYIARREGKFIFVGNPQDFQAMEHAIDRIGTRIYRPNYVKASELQSLVTPLLTQGVGTISVSTASEIGIQADDSNAGGDAFAGGEVVLVRDYEAVLEQVDQVYEELDQRPLQVAIEAMILSVKLKDTNSMGVDFQLLRDQNHVRIGTGQPLNDIGQLSFADGGLKFGFLDSSLGAFLNALESIGDTNVIATPRLMCLNKHRAEILIGAQLGYVNSTVTNLTSTTQSVSFLEVGTQLRLRPFISNDGLIRMEVHPESSTGSVRIEQGFTLPDKEVTQVTTNIMVRDGCTVIIGGLMREDLAKTSNQLPVLGSMPGVGFLFRSKTDTIERRELIVLITPHIVTEPEAYIEGEEAACEFHRRQAVYADQLSPIGSRYLGRKYFRLAQQAWASGDRQAALKYVNLAIKFDPVNRAAIDLRSDISAGSHAGDHSGKVKLPPGVPIHPLDGQAIAPWLLEDLEDPGVTATDAPLPATVGQPGHRRSLEPSRSGR